MRASHGLKWKNKMHKLKRQLRDNLWRCWIQESKKTPVGKKNCQCILQTIATPQICQGLKGLMLQNNNENNKGLMLQNNNETKVRDNWCRPRNLAHHITNSLISIMPYINLTQTLLFPCFLPFSNAQVSEITFYLAGSTFTHHSKNSAFPRRFKIVGSRLYGVTGEMNLQLVEVHLCSVGTSDSSQSSVLQQ